METDIPMFFTPWVCLIMIFAAFFERYLDLLFLGAITFVIGGYISWFDPKAFVFHVNSNEYRIEGVTKIAIVDLTHIIILCAAIAMGKGKSILGFVSTLALLCIYAVIVDIKNVYRVENIQNVYALGVAVTISYCVYLWWLLD